MVSIKQRRVQPIPAGQRSFNELHDASTMLDKRKVIPAKQQFEQVRKQEQSKQHRRGQLIDILV